MFILCRNVIYSLSLFIAVTFISPARAEFWHELDKICSAGSASIQACRQVSKKLPNDHVGGIFYCDYAPNRNYPYVGRPICHAEFAPTNDFDVQNF